MPWDKYFFVAISLRRLTSQKYFWNVVNFSFQHVLPICTEFKSPLKAGGMTFSLDFDIGYLAILSFTCCANSTRGKFQVSLYVYGSPHFCSIQNGAQNTRFVYTDIVLVPLTMGKFPQSTCNLRNSNIDFVIKNTLKVYCTSKILKWPDPFVVYHHVWVCPALGPGWNKILVLLMSPDARDITQQTRRTWEIKVNRTQRRISSFLFFLFGLKRCPFTLNRAHSERN